MAGAYILKKVENKITVHLMSLSLADKEVDCNFLFIEELAADESRYEGDWVDDMRNGKSEFTWLVVSISI